MGYGWRGFPYAYAPIVASASGQTTIVTAVSSPSKKIIRVINLELSASGSVNVKWQSVGTASTDLTGLFYISTNGGEVLPTSEVGWFQTLSGEALVLNLSAAVAVGGHLTYELIGVTP